MARFLGLLFLCLTSNVFAYKLRCDSKQTRCEIKTKRLTVGDHVGVFDKNGLLVATGKIFKIQNSIRIIKVQRKYSKILSSHEALPIKDVEARKPTSYFKLLKQSDDKGYGFQAGLVEMGVGDGISAFEVGGYLNQRWDQNLYFVQRVLYMSGAGEASSTGEKLISETVSYSSWGLLGGIAMFLLPSSNLSLRLEASIGMINVSLTSDATEPKDLVDGKVFPGTGFVARFGGSLLFRIGEWRPMIGVAMYRLQNSFNYGLHVGAYF